MSVDARARAGLFLAMQYPVEVPGVLGVQLPAHGGHRGPRRGTQAADVPQGHARGDGRACRSTRSSRERNLNEGFSGGEKKRHEILQLELLAPKIAILDETDSGLDIDALKVVAEGINRFRAAPDHGVLLITHYTRILRYVNPGLRARVRRRPDRRGGRPRTGRDPGGRRLRAVG